MKDYNNTEFKILAQSSHSYPMRATLQGCLIWNVEYFKQFNVIYEYAVSLCVQQSLCPCMCFYAVLYCLFRRRKNSRKYIYVSSKSQSHRPLRKYFFYPHIQDTVYKDCSIDIEIFMLPGFMAVDKFCLVCLLQVKEKQILLAFDFL